MPFLYKCCYITTIATSIANNNGQNITSSQGIVIREKHLSTNIISHNVVKQPSFLDLLLILILFQLLIILL